ncbi:cysteine dioxygenase family protein [Variovorax ginsengisoli]|uniref:Cysteine dioxygenase family protein n=1 Tax=Variovorax ginsengisoli TaxID=363844 RepID=A0ABT8SCP7_9BURK|nr:cysteine dioxygenase family protein [Variovorax ginsengisoli]MDN8617496.1 cysteine dioxygenase family protein [Variovorax ginsengisoli]MDO1536666.1 cysteine dioxygenase family protein [Variovorax ginsengisoli]
MNELSVPQRRELAARALMQAVRRHLEVEGPTRAALSKIGDELEKLATQHADLFSAASFPPPGPQDTGGGVRYIIHTDPETDFSLYLNALDPGKSTPPHNHMTWAAIVALEGEELNRIYRRLDDRADEAQAQLALEREFTVRRGAGIQFLPEDIHSIHIEGVGGTRHFHLYGKPLEVLDNRVGFNLKTGEVTRFNLKNLPPAKRAIDAIG